MSSSILENKYFIQYIISLIKNNYGIDNKKLCVSIYFFILYLVVVWEVMKIKYIHINKEEGSVKLNLWILNKNI